MKEQLMIDGVAYVPARSAAQSAGVTRDYIGKLCREEKLKGQRIGKLWYVDVDSLNAFLLTQQYERENRKAKLSAERRDEYKRKPVTVTSLPNREEVPQSKPVQTSLAGLATVGKMAVGQTTESARQASAHLVVHAAPVVQTSDLVSRIAALVTAFVLTFGTYGFVNAQYGYFARESVREIGVALMNTPERAAHFANSLDVNDVERLFASGIERASRQTAAVSGGIFGGEYAQRASTVARNVNKRVDAFVSSLFGSSSDSFASAFLSPESDQASVDIQVIPVATNVRPSIVNAPRTTSNQTTSLTTVPTTIVQQPVIERVVETQRVVTENGIGESFLTARLQELENKLTSQITSLTTANSTQIVNNYETISLTNRIDFLEEIDILNSDITGGTITNATITGGSLSGVDIPAGDLTGVVAIENGGTGTSTTPSFGQLLLGQSDGSYNLVATSSLGIVGSAGSPGGSNGQIQFNNLGVFAGDSDFTFSTTTNRLTVTSLVTTNATATSATSTNLFATSLRSTSATTTNLALLGGLYDVTGSAGSDGFVLQSTGTSTQWVATSSLGIVGSGGSGTPGGSGTQVQFNNFGSFAGDSTFTFSTTTDTLNLANLITTNATSTSATTTNLAILSDFWLNNERFTDLTGTGLTNTGGALTVDTSSLTGVNADTLDNANSTDFLSATTTDTAAGLITLSSGFISQASSTVSGLLNLTNATATQLTLTDLFIGGDRIADFVGTGLTLSGTTLTTTLGTDIDLTSEVTGVLPDANVANDITLDNLTQITTRNAADLQNFGDPFYTFFNATNTDALSEGSSNFYFTNNRADQRAFLAISGTTTTAIDEGSNLYFTNARADERANVVLSGTTTLPNLTTLTGLTSLVTTNATTTNATTTNLAVTGVTNSLLKTDANGLVVAAIAGTDYITDAGFGNNLSLLNSTTLAPTTTTSGIGLQVDFITATSTTASSTANLLDIATAFELGSDYITDLTGTGLQLTGSTLTTTLGTSIQDSEVDNDITLDNLTQITTRNAADLQNFGDPFYTFFNATNTDALSEGSSNFYFTQDRFDTTITATTTLPALTTLANLATVGTISTGVWQGTAVADGFVANDLTISGGTIENTPIGATTPSTAVFTNATTTNSTTTSLAITGTTNSLLKTDANGLVLAAIAGTDYLTDAGFGTNWLIEDGYLRPTTTLGIFVNASSTIGNGNQNGGLTISGGATTTGDAYFVGDVGIGIENPAATLDILSAAGANGSIRINNNANSSSLFPGILIQRSRADATAPAANFGSEIKFQAENSSDGFFSDIGNIRSFWEQEQVNSTVRYSALSFFTLNNNVSTEQLRITSAGNLGIGTTSPFTKLGVAGDAYVGGNLTATGTLSIANAVTFSNYTNGALAASADGTLYTWATSTLSSASSTLLADNNTFSGNNTFTGTNTFTNTETTNATTTNATTTNFAITGALSDTNSSIGTDGQILSSTGTGIDWIATSTLNIALANTTGTLGETRGGTGQTTYTTGDILYADGANSLARLPVGAAGQVLKVTAGLPAWGADNAGGGGGSGLWATTTNDQIVYPSDTSDIVVVGNSATSSTNTIFEVQNGNAYFTGNIGVGNFDFNEALNVQGVATAQSFAATSTTATSTFAGGLTVDTSDFVVDPDAGRVGIGTANPNSLLNIAAPGSSAVFRIDADSDASSGSHTASYLHFVNDAGAFNTYFGLGDNADTDLLGATVTGIPANSFITQRNAGNFVWAEGDIVRMIIDGDGDVGIGTTSPATRFSVAGDTYLGGNLTATGTLTTENTVTFSNYTNGALAVGGSGDLYVWATSSLSSASSTLLADNNTFSGNNTFTGLNTFTNATATQLTLTDLFIGGDRIADFVGTGLTLSGTTLTTTLGTDIDLTSEVTGVLPDANVANDLTIAAGTIENTPIGATTPSTGVFTNSTTTNATTTTLAITGTLNDGTSVGTNGQILQTTGSGITWVATSSLNIDTTLSEAQVEAFIFDGDNSGTLSSGTLALDSLSYSGDLNDAQIADDITASNYLALTDWFATTTAPQLTTLANLATVGTISTGVWQGTAVADGFVANDLTISGGTIENTPIGAATPSTGVFTTATTTSATSTAFNTTTFGINSEYFTDLTGTGLTNTGGALTVDTSSLTGVNADTLDNANSTDFLSATTTDTAAGLITLSSGFISQASSTVSGLLNLTNATATQLTLTDLFIGGDRIADFVGTGLTLSGTTLTTTLGTDIAASEIANGDHGDFTYSSGNATLDTNVVADNEIDYSAVTLNDFTNDAGFITDAGFGNNLSLLNSTTLAPTTTTSGIGLQVDFITATSTTASSTANLLDIATAFELGSDYITDLTGTGLQLTGSTLTTTLGTSIQDSEVDNDITLDNLTQITTRNAADLQNFGDPFYTFFNATNTDALSEGSSNFYFTAARFNDSFDTRFAATSTTGLSEGSNLYFTNARADERANLVLSGTTTLPNLTTLTGLTDLITTRATTTNATTTTLAITGTLNDGTSVGTNGQILQTTGSGITWVATSSLNIDTTLSEAQVEAFIFDGDNSGTLSSGTLALDSLSYSGDLNDAQIADDITASNYLALTDWFATTTAPQLTTLANLATVGTISTGVWQGTAVADGFVANDLTISGGTIENTPIGAATPSTGVFTNSTSTSATTTNLAITSLVSSLLATDANGTVVATTTLGANLIPDNFLRNDQDDTTTGQLTATNFVASSGTATSTFAGGLTVQTNFLVVEDGSGNVGVGTAAPVYDLDVVGSFRAQEDANNYARFLQSGSAPLLELVDNGLIAVSIDSNGNSYFNGGNLGIGTTSPFATLSIAGSGYFDSNITGTNLTATGTLSVAGDTTLANATSTSLGITGLTSTLLKTDAAGSVVAAIAGTDYITDAGFGNAWELANGFLQPTTTQTILANNGFVSQASSTVSGLLNLTNATATQLTLTDLFIGGDRIADFVGTGLTLSGTTLTTTLGTDIDLTSEVTGVLPDANVANDITLDNLTQITTRNAADLQNFGDPFYTFFNATNTDALSEGSSNFYFTQDRFDTTITATTTLPALTTLANLATVGTISTGVWQGTAVADGFVANDLTISGGTIENTPIGATTPSTAVFTNATTTNSTTTSLAITGTTNSLLKTDANGLVLAAIAGTDYLTDVGFGNNWSIANGYLQPTTSITTLHPNGFVSQASSTVSALLNADNFAATNASATSTFAGGLNVESGGLLYDYQTDRVGIGTDSPLSILHVRAGSVTAGNSGSVVINDGNTDSSTQLRLGIDTSLGTPSGWIQAVTGGVGNRPLLLNPSGSIVGVGTTTPVHVLDVDGDFRVGEQHSADAFFVDATNARVGIGNASPEATTALDVSGGNILIDNNQYLQGETSGGTNIDLIGLNSSNNFIIGDTSLTGGENIQIYTPNNGSVNVLQNDGSTSNLYILETGNIGIGGDTGPDARLEIIDGGADIFQISATANGNGDFVTVDTDGNFGIGSTTPGSLLGLGGIANFTTATSTFYGSGGINLADGCFSIDGTCIGAGGGGISALTGETLAAGNFLVGNAEGLSQATSSIFIDPTGNLGVGTANPATKLDVLGTASSTDLFVTGSATTTNLAITGGLYDTNGEPGTSGQLLSSTGSGIDWIDSSSLGGGLKSVQVFTSSGTWTRPAGIDSIRVIVVGAGGGGGFDEAGGGGAGGVAIEVIDVSATSSVTVTVGSGGSGDTNTGGSGGDGGSSSFGTFLSATGGDGANSEGASPERVPGVGGVGSGGDINLTGGAGGAPYGSTGQFGGVGGSNPYGGGGRGGDSSSHGSNGGNYGGGGGGGSITGSGTNGGDGAAGVVIVYEYDSDASLASTYWTQNVDDINFTTGDVSIGTTASPARLTVQASSTDDILNLLETGGSEVLTVLESGFVGIGTTSPASLLDVWGDLTIGTSSTPTLFADVSTNRVGIGTTTPGSLLGLGGIANFTTATSTFYSSGGIEIASGCFSVNGTCLGGGGISSLEGVALTAGNFLVGNAEGLSQATSSIFLSPLGNFGIGTSSPFTDLSVGGDGYFDGSVTASTITATSTATSSIPTLSVTGRLYDANGTGGTNGYVLQTNGSGIEWVATSTLGISGGGDSVGGGLKSVQVFSTAGSGTWTRPAGIDHVRVIVTGGGGGGAGARSTGFEGGGGGGAGATAIEFIDVSATSSIAYTVGAAGTGGNGNNDGNAGGASSFSTFVVAGGGSGGQNVDGDDGPGGAGGTVTTSGDIDISGGSGGEGNGSSPTTGGAGGGSYWGSGGAEVYSLSNAGQNGEDANSYGAGGGGASDDQDTNKTGGDGAAGIIVVYEYDSDASAASTLWTDNSPDINYTTGDVSIGTTASPARLTVQASSTDDILNLLETGGSEVLTVLESGFVGVGTTTPGSLLGLNGIANFTTATSTFYSSGGIEIASGCFSVNGTCLGGGGISSLEGVALTTGNFLVGNAEGLSQATSTIFLDPLGNFGVGTTTPYSKLTVWGASTGNIFEAVTNGSSTALVVNAAGQVGIGTDAPENDLDVVGSLRVRQDDNNYARVLQSGSAPLFQLVDNGLVAVAIDSDGLSYLNGGDLGIGVIDPDTRLEVFETVAGSQLKVSYDATRYAQFQVDSVGDLIIDPQGNDAFLNDDNLFVCTGGACPTGSPSGTGNLVVESRIGIGTSTPDTLLGLQAADNSSFIQLTAAGAARFTLGTDASGNTIGYTSNSLDLRLGSTSAPTQLVIKGDSGRVGIGTTSPVAQLSVNDLLYVGAGGVTALGNATSTFQGDIRITGKLDVGTIDPVYTIDGTKYATYGHSTIGIKEEVLVTTMVDAYDEVRDKYVYTVALDELEEGSDLWLFHQITEFGDEWERLVVALTPAFDGTVFYEKDIENNELRIVASSSGEVSMRLAADRFDAANWPNLRPDQDDPYTNFRLDGK